MKQPQTPIAGLTLKMLQDSAHKPEPVVAARAFKQVVVVAAGVQCSKRHRGSGNEFEAGTGGAYAPLLEMENHGGGGIEAAIATETFHGLQCMNLHMLETLMCKKLTPAHVRGGGG